MLPFDLEGEIIYLQRLITAETSLKNQVRRKAGIRALKYLIILSKDNSFSPEYGELTLNKSTPFPSLQDKVQMEQKIKCLF